MNAIALDRPTTPPRTSSTASGIAKACLRHGPLAQDATSCPRCQASAYRLDDEGDRATLRAYRKAALKSRMGSFAAAGAVLGVAGHNLALQLTRPGTFTLDLAVLVVAAVVGAGIGWAARTPGQHRLDRLLK